MSCEIQRYRREVCFTSDSCIVCRGPGDVTQKRVEYTPGHDYTDCMLVAWHDENCKQVVPLTAADQTIAGLVTCARDLTDDADVCPAKILFNATLDPNCIAWPDSLSDAEIDCIVVRNENPFFRARQKCAEIPSQIAANVNNVN